MFRKLLLGSLFAFTLQATFTQEADSSSFQLPLNEYYYCFAMFEDTIFYTNVFQLEFDTISKFQAIDEQWTNHVRNTLKLELHVPIVIGPYTNYEGISNEQEIWKASQPDSVNLLITNFEYK